MHRYVEKTTNTSNNSNQRMQTGHKEYRKPWGLRKTIFTNCARKKNH